MFSNIPIEALQPIMNQFGGPQQFQTAVNNAQNVLVQHNVTMEQFMQNPAQAINQMGIPKERLDWAMEQANKFYGRR